MASTPIPLKNRVFSDSSVLYSAAYSTRGYAFELITAGIRGELVLCLSPLVLTETERNIRQKAPHVLSAFQVLAPILSTYLVTPSAASVRRVARLIHPKDAPIVAGALAARSRNLATYDRRHLLNHADEIRASFGLLVMTPDDVLVNIREPNR